MADIIQQLPDAIANQIAAGEVVQRPASVVKELMENSIDAGSTKIHLVIKDAGSTLIQVIDNGCGMSETDARMSFERHATSKLRKSEDLFTLRTMGFRGEAMASIAAIAQVELRTRRNIDELGVKIVVEGSEVKTQEACQLTSSGTNIAVKNIFFNTPARRGFLKSNAVETKHIIDEFQRIAIANPDVYFTLVSNNVELFHLPPGNQRQRVAAVLGSSSNKKLIEVEEKTDVLEISGYVGMPEYARKTKADQYFFVNKRFIKSPYLNHAVTAAYENIIASDTHPIYVIFIEVDPRHLDVNVHPTKQEIKFEDSKLVYNYLKVAVKHAIGLAKPTLDFDQELSFNIRPTIPDYSGKSNDRSRSDFNAGPSGAFRGDGDYSEGLGASATQKNNLKHWEQLYEVLGQKDLIPEEPGDSESKTVTLESSVNRSSTEGDLPGVGIEASAKSTPYQIHGQYIVSQIKSGFMLIDQQEAHERILYEYFRDILQQQKVPSQKQLFPQTMELSAADALLFEEIKEEVEALGFDISSLGNCTYAINGIPSETVGHQKNDVQVVEQLIGQYRSNLKLNLDTKDNIARAMAKSTRLKKGKQLSPEEMQVLIDQLFACNEPFRSPSGRHCFITIELEELDKRFSH